MSGRKLLLIILCLVCVGIGATSLVGNRILAASDGPNAPDEGLAIPWWTVDTGGGASQAGSYTLTGTAGQPDTATLSGGTYTLKGGYWSGSIDYITNLPMIVR
jgi:hypothetical protein